MTDHATTHQDAQPVLLSLIVPLYNEAQALPHFFARVEPILEGLTAPLRHDYEIICVDDGSSDATLAVLLGARARNPRIRILSLARNFGKEAALSAGLDHVRGAAVIPIDADLQDPPEVIPELVQQWVAGFEVGYGVRNSRDGDSALKRLSARAFYRGHNALAQRPIPQDAGDFRLLDRRVVEALRALPERTRFMKGLFAWVGFRQTAIHFDRPARVAGHSKWSAWKLWNLAIEGVTSSSTLPLRVWSYLGMLIFLAALFYGGFLVVRTLVWGVGVPGYASLMVSILFFGGLNLLTLGILGEYLGRVLAEVRQRPLYLVRLRFGFEAGQSEDDRWTPASIPGLPPSKTSTGGSQPAAASSAPSYAAM
jgi:glycosyltransferase involved in cell wall biosynthesis